MKITEENFICELQCRNEQALEYVITNYGWIIKSVVKKHLYHLENYHEECINDILMGIWNNISQFDPSRNTFKNWVAGISKFKSFDYMRKYLKDLEHTNIEDVEENISTKSDEFLIDEENTYDRLLACLSEKDRDLFTRLYIEEQHIEEISHQTGLKTEVIYNRVSRGKRKIRQLFHLTGR